MSEENQVNQGRVRKDGNGWKERVIVEDAVFFPQYKQAMTSGVKLADFAAKIGQAPGTIQQRIANANKKLKEEGYTKFWRYLSTSTGATRGRKTSTAEQLAKFLEG